MARYRDEVLDAFRAAPRIAFVRMHDGIVALNSTMRGRVDPVQGVTTGIHRAHADPVRGREPGAPIPLTVRDEVHDLAVGETRMYTLGRARE